MYFRLLASTVIFIAISNPVLSYFDDICGIINGKQFYLEHGESGSLRAEYQNNILPIQNKNITSNRCTIEYITCPSCIIEVKFRYLNISRNHGKASVFDTCGRDYVWIYEPPIQDISGEQFCGKFIQSNASELNYISQTRTITLAFIYNDEYGYAFSLDYYTKRNKIQLNGYPTVGNMNNASQFISSPFFPYMYPNDLSVEYVITCESMELCRISLIFTDFLIAESSIIEFFDWNDERMYVISGNMFRPPVILTTGPILIIRFYANGASGFGFKASYSFILGNLEDETFKPNMACGGFVNNLGGGITMMNMVQEGTTLFDCVWIIKAPENYYHKKTHLYVKVVNFLNFAGTTELVIREGLTSSQPAVDVLRYPMAPFSLPKQAEHVVPSTKGFYISLRGYFRRESHLAIVFAAFNYKDCFGGSDFLCHNLRCISILLNCDGFDHCGDNSDESPTCSADPKDHRKFSKIPNFLFPKMEPYSDIATATLVFLTCSFGLIGIILAMALLLYRMNSRARHQRQIQDHIETIHAILEEGIGDVEEEIIIPDDPPDYEAPPDYDEIINLYCLKKVEAAKLNYKRCSRCTLPKKSETVSERTSSDLSELTDVEHVVSVSSTKKRNQAAPLKMPDSPPPSYENIKKHIFEKKIVPTKMFSCVLCSQMENLPAGPSHFSCESKCSEAGVRLRDEDTERKAIKYFENMQKYQSQLFSEIRKSFRNCKSVNLIKRKARKVISLSEENLVRYGSDTELIFVSNVDESCWARSSCKLKRSFSTDDIISLL